MTDKNTEIKISFFINILVPSGPWGEIPLRVAGIFATGVNTKNGKKFADVIHRD
jgi:hypothetical protein